MLLECIFNGGGAKKCCGIIMHWKAEKVTALLIVTSCQEP